MNQTKERGIALVAVLVALLLLSVVSLGMMYSSNTESLINTNFRTSQTALYSAMAGLQEARDRIQPATLTITPPSGLPSTSAANVVYIINPKNGETVAPWDINNAYADTDLCHASVMSLTGTNGVPCTSLPTGSSWYRTFDDSQSSAGAWNVTQPFDFKWVRVMLKTNNMTPVAANGSSATTNQVCWDGKNQILLPTGYGPNCNRIGSVIGINVTNSGAGYTSAPTVTISAPPSGTTATATANMQLVTQQMVSSITVTNSGSGYATAPTVTLVGGQGSGATAHVGSDFIPANGAPVGTLSVTDSGTRCYATAPSVAFTSGGGSGAAAAATLAGTDSCIAGITFSGPCARHKGETLSGVGLSGTVGSGFSATLTFDTSNGYVTGYTIQSSGTGYSVAPTSITGVSGCGSLTFIPSLGRRVSTLTLTSGGSGYTSAPTMSFSTGVGTTQTQPAATATLAAVPANAGKVLSIVVDSGGTGYNHGSGGAPTVVFSSSSGSGAAATVNLAPVGGTNYYKVASITITNQGYGYTLDPTVTISGGAGSGATAEATLGRGSSYGKVYLMTALAQTSTGARAMVQMEAVTPLTGFNATGALTIGGPDPAVQNFPNSTNFYLRGNDTNSCGDSSADSDHAAIGTYDDPNSDSTSTETVAAIATASPGASHYTGDGGTATTPSVQNVYPLLGDTMGTPTGLKALTDAVNAQKTNTGNTVSLGSSTSPAINYINGNLTLSGSNSGYGILVVTGSLFMDGNFSWTGTILVVGDGIFDFTGGGNGQITGMIFVAKIWDNYTSQNLLASLGQPTLNWSGGGGNGIQYDHCWTTNLMSRIAFDAPPSTRPLKVLSVRRLP